MDKFGGVEKSEVRDLAGQDPIPELAGRNLIDRFVRCVVDLFAARKENGDGLGCTYFLLSSSILSDMEDRLFVEFPLLRHGNDPISGRIWVTNATMGTAFQMPLMPTDPNQALANIKSEGFGSMPLLIIDCRGHACRASLYVDGCGTPDFVSDVDLNDGPIDSAQLFESLNLFHATIHTPLALSATGNEYVWSNATAGTPVERPEKAIQKRLVGHFTSSLTRYTVRSEVTNSTGRADVQLIRQMVGPAGQKVFEVMWTIELKVTADATSSGSAKSPDLAAQLEEGIAQAIIYKKSDGATSAALCCFDMRKTVTTADEYFKSITQIANDNVIFLWHGHIHRTSASLRRTLVGGGSG